MDDQLEVSQGENYSLTRALALPLSALCFAMVLIYVGPEDPNIRGQVITPDKLASYHLRAGLRNIAITFGLACFPGVLIGAAFGYLLAANSQLASASISLLRIGQWAPFVIWWVLVTLLFIAPGPGQRTGKYFFDLTMSIPAVALGVCYHFLCTRHLLRLDSRTSVFVSLGPACHRALFISIVLALSVRLDHWVVVYANDSVVRHYVAACVLAFLLFVVNWTFGIDHSAASYRETLVADLRRRGGASFGTATLLIILLTVFWQVLNQLGYFRVSPASVFGVAGTLISATEIWLDTQVSLIEIMAGIVVSGTLVLTISATLLNNSTIRKWTLTILSLTFAVPMILLPAWHGSLFRQGHYIWYAVSVACLSFYPMMQTVWALREEPLLYRIFLAVDQALPYALAATLYSQMMSATAGLGFATIVPSATLETEKAFAIFLFTLALLVGLSSTLRLLARWSYFSSVSFKENQIPTP